MQNCIIKNWFQVTDWLRNVIYIYNEEMNHHDCLVVIIDLNIRVVLKSLWDKNSSSQSNICSIFMIKWNCAINLIYTILRPRKESFLNLMQFYFYFLIILFKLLTNNISKHILISKINAQLYDKSDNKQSRTYLWHSLK